MSLLKDGLLPIFQQGVLNQIFAGGFKNVFEMQHGAEPKHFDITRYKQALQTHDLTDRLRLLKQDAWQPGDGDYLGALHYLYSIERLKQCYKNTLSENDDRRGKALFLVHRMDNYSHGLPKDFLNGGYSLELNIGNEGDESSEDYQNIIKISQYISCLAMICRWDSRVKGTLENLAHREVVWVK